MKAVFTVAVFIISMAVSAAAQAQSYEEAANLYRYKQYKTVFPILQKMAAEGDSRGQFLLGQMYEYGLSVPVNNQLASFWYGKSADQGNRDGQSGLSRLPHGTAGDPSNAPTTTPSVVASSASTTAETTSTINRLQNEREQSDACLVQLREAPQLQFLYAKLPFDLTKAQSIEVLANRTKPTLKEKAALSAYSTEKERCLDIGNNWRREALPLEAQTLITNFRAESTALLADLYAGQVTFGEVAKVRAKQASVFTQNLDALARKYQAQNDAQEKQRVNDEATARALQAAVEQQQKLTKQQLDQQAEQLRLAKEQAQRQKEQDLNRAIDRFIQTTRPPLSKGFTCNTDRFGNGTQTTCN